MNSFYTSKEGKKEILDLYDQKLSELNIHYDHKIVSTAYGQTNILITGNPSNPPILIIHGSNSCAPIALETYLNLSDKFQVYAIDILAQPNKSEGLRLSMKDDSYGQWIHEIVSVLKLKDVTMAGFSFGGLVILKTLEFNESNIKEVFLSAPAYIVNGNPIKALFKIFIPMKKFIKTKKEKYIHKFLKEIFTNKDEFAVNYLSKVFLHFEMDFTPVPTISKQKAKKIKTPITIIGAEDDILFPGNKMIKRASQIFPSLKKHLILKNSKHVFSPQDNLMVEKMILNK